MDLLQKESPITESVALVRRKLAASEVVYLGIFLILIQILDGALTLLGVEFLGLHIEANGIMRRLMERMGYAESLLLAKSFVILLILHLIYVSNRIHWVREAIGAVCCYYLFAAIFPWTYILTTLSLHF